MNGSATVIGSRNAKVSLVSQSIERIAETHRWGNQSSCRSRLPIVGEVGWERRLMRRGGDREAVVGGTGREIDEFLDGGERCVFSWGMRRQFGDKLVGSIPDKAFASVHDGTSHSGIVGHGPFVGRDPVGLTLRQSSQFASGGQRGADFLWAEMVDVHVEWDFRRGNCARCTGGNPSLHTPSVVCGDIMIFDVVFVVGGAFHDHGRRSGFSAWFGLGVVGFKFADRDTIFNKVGAKQWREIVSNLVTPLQANFASNVIRDPVQSDGPSDARGHTKTLELQSGRLEYGQFHLRIPSKTRTTIR